MGEHCDAVHVADRPDTAGSAKPVVDLDSLFRDGEIEVLEAETLHVRPPAGGNEQPLGLDRPAAFEMEAEAWLDSIELRAEVQLDSLALELLAQEGAGFRVLSGQQPLGDVDERHV